MDFLPGTLNKSKTPRSLHAKKTRKTMNAMDMSIYEGDEDVFPANEILGKRRHEGKIQYHIQWKDYRFSEWIAAIDVTPDLKNAYNKALRDAGITTPSTKRMANKDGPVKAEQGKSSKRIISSTMPISKYFTRSSKKYEESPNTTAPPNGLKLIVQNDSRTYSAKSPIPSEEIGIDANSCRPGEDSQRRFSFTLQVSSSSNDYSIERSKDMISSTLPVSKYGTSLSKESEDSRNTTEKSPIPNEKVRIGENVRQSPGEDSQCSVSFTLQISSSSNDDSIEPKKAKMVDMDA